MPTTLEIALAAFAILAVGFLLDQHRRVRTLRREREEIEIEEHRMFDFLHGLGEALQSDSTAKNINRLVVRGVVRVVAARGGCLYLLDKSGDELVPAFRTPDCPPFIPVPKKILDSTTANEKALESYLRLQSIPRDFGILGETFISEEPRHTEDLGSHATLEEGETVELQRNVPAMIAPLAYAGNEIGVLGVAGKASGSDFTENDYDVFRSIAEQSSFALGSALIHLAAHEKTQLEKELKNASEIQRILLPFSAPSLDDFVIAAVNYPAKIVSGDYFDYIRVDDNHYGIVIGDVSGKGIPASLIMAMCRSVVRSLAASNLSPAAVLSHVNRVIFPDIREDMFVSMGYCILEKNSEHVTLVRAGHDPPLLFHKADNSVEILKPPGLAVGIDGGAVFERVTHDYSFAMESGDTLLFYTDGATEALDKNGMEFGLDPIQKALIETASEGAQAVLDRISADIRTFLGENPQNDDITLIALQKR